MADGEVKILNLGPAVLEQGWYRHDTPEQAIVNTYRDVLSHTVSEMLLEDDFAAADVKPRMFKAFDDITPSVVMETLEDERLNWGPDSHYTPLNRYVGQLALDTETETRFEVSPEFSSQLREQLDALPYDFSVLETWREKFSNTKYLDLVKRVHDIADGKGRSVDWANEVFDLVKEASEQPENYTLPLDDAEAIALVCFLPGKGRAFTRRIIVNNALAAHTRANLGVMLDDAEEIILGALERYLAIDMLTDAFDTHARKGLSQDNNVLLGLLNAEQLDALGYVRELLDEGRGTRVVRAWRAAREKLNDTVDKATADNPASYWAMIDTGHGLHNFSHHDLYDVFTFEPGMRHEYGHAPKDGSRALILEDDPVQMDAWKRSVTRHMRAVTDDNLCFSVPDGIEAVVSDDSIGLFVLDMQNGEDIFAGLRAAELVLHDRAAKLLALGEEEREIAPKTQIILWTASYGLVEEAVRYFKPRIEYLKETLDIFFGYSIPGGGSSSSIQALSFDIRLKGWSVHDTASLEIPRLNR